MHELRRLTELISSRVRAMHFEYVDSFDRFIELEAEWDHLESRSSCHIFQNHRFLRTWLETAGKHSKVRLSIVLYREDRVLQAVFPVCVTRRMGIPTLSWLGGFHVVDYGDILFDQSADLPVSDFIRGALDIVQQRIGLHVRFFDNVRDDAAAYRFLQDHFRPYRNTVAPFIRLSDSFEQYMDSLKVFRKKMKSDTLRQIRRLSELGFLEFRVCEHGEQDIDFVVQAFLDQKRARLHELGKAGAIELPGYADLLFDEAHENRYTHVSYLSLNNQIIAVHFGYHYRNKTFYYYMPSFASEYAAYSPGRVLIYYLLKLCYEQGVGIFDFTAGDEPYKYDWTRDEASVTSFMGSDAATRAARFLLRLRNPRSSIPSVRAALRRHPQAKSKKPQ
jgi:CelD/BcsL family acetyltransferase involved in cellulose biosynthesis